MSSLVDTWKNRLADTGAGPVCIRGGGSKWFLWENPPPESAVIETGAHEGVIDYHPAELVIRARSGTRLASIEQLLEKQRQMLPFEPPQFRQGATLGGMVAAGLSGPARPFAGAVRDNLLGVGLINGRGEHMQFGGQVMKNVAGYDVSRVMAGAFGTLGLITEVSLRVMPMPAGEQTVVREADYHKVREFYTKAASQHGPLSATLYDGERFYARFSGSKAAVKQFVQAWGGEPLLEADFWARVKNHQLAFFQHGPLWRVSVPPAAPQPPFEHQMLEEWCGALRWLVTHETADSVMAYARDHGGWAWRFHRGEYGDGGCLRQPPSEGVQRLNRRVKAAFDPGGILNPGCLDAGSGSS